MQQMKSPLSVQVSHMHTVYACSCTRVVCLCVSVCECAFVQVVRTVRDSARTEALVLPEGPVFAETAGQETTVHRVRKGEMGRRERGE